MIDPQISLAFSVYSNKGVYALLLGSGISNASGIPTGWHIVLDLIRKVAKLHGEDSGSAPDEWFKRKYSADPDYSKLLDEIGKTPAERQQLLRTYFEPNEEERAQNQKSPTTAHKAIAQLVAAGYVRVIITTNFDRLMEKALEEIGVSPTVISSSDQVAGSFPLAHSGATLIKLHGDYRDTRIKNTASELESYDAAMNGLLDRVIDEYGLIICGWSAEWDIALRNAIERCPSRRFTTYWTKRSELSGHAQRLAGHRRAEVIQITDANRFFDGLWEKVRSLADLASPHPLSAKIAVATVKRYLMDPAAKIRLHDLVSVETEKLIKEANGLAFSAQAQAHLEEEYKKRLHKYESICEILLGILTTGCYWGDQSHARLWIDCLERVANSRNFEAENQCLNWLRRYPALLLIYGGGVAAVAGRNYQNLADILIKTKIKTRQNEKVPVCSTIDPVNVIAHECWKLITDRPGNTPVSDYLFEKMRSPLREYLPGEDDYEIAFNRFEYLFGLVHADTNREDTGSGWKGPYGRFAWRGRHFGRPPINDVIQAEMESEGQNWGPLKTGLFGGSIDKAKLAKTKYDSFLYTLSF